MQCTFLGSSRWHSKKSVLKKKNIIFILWCFLQFHFIYFVLSNFGSSLMLFPSVTTLLGTSAPTESMMAPMSHSFKPPPLPSPFPLSSGRRRFTVTGAASSDSLPICHRHRRGILVHFLNNIPKNHADFFFFYKDCLHFDTDTVRLN